MNEISDDLLRMTAQLYYLDGLDQTQVAEIVGISRSQISRMLARAREKGIVRITVEDFDPRQPALEQALCAAFGLKHAFVIRVLGSEAGRVRKTVAHFGAPLVQGLLQPNSLVGIAGGRSLFDLLQQFSPSDGQRGVGVLQLMGNLSPDVHSTDSAELAHLLAHTLGGPLYTMNAPIYVADPQARRSFTEHAHVQAVMKMYQSLQTALIGIGSLDDSFFIERNILPAGDLARLNASGAVGETCGRFYDQAGKECDLDFREQVLSISFETLRQVPEVIGVASGARKLVAIYPALRSGLIKSLLTDEITAAALLEMARSKTASA
jgi:DNA-binding transcriptional regulator LsrR (DeoR family)